MVIYYSQTINKFTLVDEYPLLCTDDTIKDIAPYGVYSTIDLGSAYHKVAIKLYDKVYITFEAGGQLSHFCRIPFSVMNGMASFQRIIFKLKLKGIYIDNITVCSHD